ncbi:MAG: ribonuclease R [Hellea sp.]|nr:ribonuclease R [Hellea sp.]
MELVRGNPDKLTLKDLARRLGIKGDDRRELRGAVREMVEGGLLVKTSRKTYREAGTLPAVMVLRISEIDTHGDMVGSPENWRGEGDPPRMIVREGPASKKAKGHASAQLGIGSRALCKIKPTDQGYVAQVMKKLGRGGMKHLGILYQDGRGWSIKPVDKKARNEFRPINVPEGAEIDSLVEFRTSNSKRGNSYEKRAEITRIIGPANDPKAASLISLKQHGIPVGFDDEVIAEARALKLRKLDKYREDLRKLPLITIDPVDAKDFDDAVFARPDDDPKNKGGWIVWVAIADVAAFVQPGSALDVAAREKGNSVYLPDRVEPMLPMELSADLCSLRPNEDRACMAVKMRFRGDGSKVDHEFTRGIMRSHARLTYAQAQEGFDGKPGEVAETVIDTLRDIYAAYKALLKARNQRAPLAIELPERRVHVNKKGEVTKITIKERFDAHKLVEEFMVQANVAAAEALADKGVTTIVRVHEPPNHEKIQGLSDFLPAVGLKWSMGERVSTQRFNHLLKKATEEDLAETVGMAVLRTQSQAYYGPEPKGHFGLSLSHYAHFTSPIRRYADLVVHRALIRAFNLGHDGTTEEEHSRLKETSEHISNTERRAMAAERDANDRYVAAYLEGRVGAEFPARITGVAKAGLFVTLDETGADGFIPARTIGDDFYMFDEKKKALVNSNNGDIFRFGRKVTVKLVEATPITGGLIFEILTAPERGPKPKHNPRGRNQKYKNRSGKKRRR